MVLLACAGVVGMGLWITSHALAPRTVGDPVAPDPHAFSDAVVQVYGADVWGFRGRFAIHTWIATKARGADTYRIYQVIGWRARRGQPVLSVSSGRPDVPWFGSAPVLLYDRTGTAAESLVERIHSAALAYPYPREYVMWPGPNSNSFTQWIASQLPELELRLPAKAIGKNWMIDNLGPILMTGVKTEMENGTKTGMDTHGGERR